MPFDKGRKRKLVDTCGHERCYSCMFKNEACPLCFAEKGKLFGRNYYLDNMWPTDIISTDIVKRVFSMHVIFSSYVYLIAMGSLAVLHLVTNVLV